MDSSICAWCKSFDDAADSLPKDPGDYLLSWNMEGVGNRIHICSVESPKELNTKKLANMIKIYIHKFNL